MNIILNARIVAGAMVNGNNFALWIEKQNMPLEVAREILELNEIHKDLLEAEEILNTEINGG